MTGAWKIEIAQVRLTRIPQTAQAGPLEPFLRVVMGVTECEVRMPIELPDGSQYFPPRVTASNRGDHAFKTSGNPLLAGLFLPMKGTKDLFRVKLMDRSGDRSSELGAFTVDVSDMLESAYFTPQGHLGEFKFHEALPSSPSDGGGGGAVVGSCVMRLTFTLKDSLALMSKEKGPTYVLDQQRVPRGVSEDEDTLPMYSGIPSPRKRSCSSGGPLPMFVRAAAASAATAGAALGHQRQ